MGGKMTMQQINTPTGPKFIAGPSRTLPGRYPTGRRSSPAWSQWPACSASAGGRRSDLLFSGASKLRSVGSYLLLGDWSGFYASSEPSRQPASGDLVLQFHDKDLCNTAAKHFGHNQQRG